MVYCLPESVDSYSKHLELFVRATGKHSPTRFLDYGGNSRAYANWLAQHGECSISSPDATQALKTRSFHGVHLKDGLEQANDLNSVFAHVAYLLVEGGVVMTTFRDFSFEEDNQRTRSGLPSITPESITQTCHVNGISISLVGRLVPNYHVAEDKPQATPYHVLLGTLTVPA